MTHTRKIIDTALDNLDTLIRRAGNIGGTTETRLSVDGKTIMPWPCKADPDPSWGRCGYESLH